MSIQSQAELKKLRVIGKIVRITLDEMSAAVRPGVTTAEPDAVGAAALAGHGAESSPPKVYGFPGTACISVNDEAIHGSGAAETGGGRSGKARRHGGERWFRGRCGRNSAGGENFPDSGCFGPLRRKRLPAGAEGGAGGESRL
jgi:hypothetical protein